MFARCTRVACTSRITSIKVIARRSPSPSEVNLANYLILNYDLLRRSDSVVLMAAIIPFLQDAGVFEPADIKGISMAFEDVCRALELDNNERARKTVAVRIIELARRGERSPTKLRDRALAEANGA
jgi:hypothetical protein